MNTSKGSVVCERAGRGDVPVDNRNWNKYWPLALLGVLVLAAVLRFYQLGTENLWVDEGYSLRDATSSTVQRASRPLYFLVLSNWMHLGQSDWLLRVPSVFFDLATIALIFLLGRMIWGIKAGVIAALLATVSPLHVNHSQEVRMYTLLALTGAGAFYFFIQAMWHRRKIHIIGCAVCLLLALMTHPIACLLLLPVNLAALEAHRKKPIPLFVWFTAQAAILLVWLPQLPSVASFSEGYCNQSYLCQMRKPGIIDIPIIWGKFGISEWGGGGRLINSFCYIYTLGVTLLLGFIAWKERRKLETRWAVIWLVVPTVALMLISAYKANGWVIRYLMFITPVFFLLLGAAVSQVRRKAVFAALCLFLLVPASGKLARYYLIVNRPQWKLAVEYIKKRERTSDTIALYRNSIWIIFDHYYNGKSDMRLISADDFLKDNVSEFSEWNEEKAMSLIETLPAGKRQWLVLSRVPRGSMEYISEAIKHQCRVIASEEFKEISVYLLERRPKPIANHRSRMADGTVKGNI